MKVCVIGLWHLGCVTAACLSKLGIEVIGVAEEAKTAKTLNHAVMPIYEPGLKELTRYGLENGTLSFTDDYESAVKASTYIWICFDTPVDEDDNADEGYVFSRIEKACRFLTTDQGIVISSQLPVGSAKKIEGFLNDSSLHLAISPENLRLGKSIDIFMHPDRIILGVRAEDDRKFFEPLFSKITDRLVWMNPESAEMVKHAINSFLATSIVFINEIASICETVGADASEVSKGLLTEKRIGPMAYLKPGCAFSGGTLARDIKYLIEKAKGHGVKIPQIENTKISNDNHKDWAYDTVHKAIGKYRQTYPSGIVKMCAGAGSVMVLGLAYKSDTDTLRRSLALELIHKLVKDGFEVTGFDVHIDELPETEKGLWTLTNDPITAIKNTECVVIMMNNDKYEEMGIIKELSERDNLIIVDENAFLSDIKLKKGTWYCTVGKEIMRNVE